MDSKELRGLYEAYSEVYAPQQLDEASVRGGRVTGSNPKVYRPATTSSGPAGGGMYGMRGTGRNRNSTQTSSSPGALRVTSSSAKPAPTPTPTPKPAPTPTPTARPATSTSTARPATSTSTARPATSTPKPAATGSTKTMPTTGSGYKKDTSITDMIGRSQIRQGAPINTGNRSSDIRSMAARGTDFGGAGPAAPKPAAPVNKATGSKKPGSVYSGFDMFDLVKGHLLDEGYADTEEAAIAIMANMSEEWRDSILYFGR